MTGTIRVALADDHPLIRRGIRSALTDACDIVVVGEATNGDEVRRLCRDVQPDVVLLDLNMPGPPARETVAYLRSHCPQVKVVILTAHDSEAYVRSLVTTGAYGYVLKDEAPETVVEAVRTVSRGKTWFSQQVIGTLLTMNGVSGGVGELAGSTLTPCEWQVLQILKSGKTNQAIADVLYISESTVRFHLRNIYEKLQVANRGEAIAWIMTHDRHEDEPIYG